MLRTMLTLSTWMLTFVLATLFSGGPASASCDEIMQVVRASIDGEVQRTERFRMGNRSVFKEIHQLREKYGASNPTDDALLIKELMLRMNGVHAGLQKQNDAMSKFRADGESALKRGDCEAVKAAFSIWQSQSKIRVLEYDEYFAFLDGVIVREKARAGK
ncbi:MAG: hypothetical protein HOP09_06760 [Hyphomicrobium sp.]|nr:hypothetical protein [Hyphomicrobium sp.]